ncbi:uncharacterized protein LOC144172820 [Haemaphysalis longicornis]
MSKRRTDTYCFAPGCHSGYPGAPKASLFAAPLDDELHQKWEQNLGRLDEPLTISSAVGERHFEPKCILRDYIHVINGCEVRLARGKLSLAPGTVPTILPDCASNSVWSTRKPQRKSGEIDSLAVANSVLQEADSSSACKGAMTATEFSANTEAATSNNHIWRRCLQH